MHCGGRGAAKSGKSVYYYGIRMEYFPSGSIYLYQRQYCPFELLPNGYRGQCPRRPALWRWYRRFNECNAALTLQRWPLDPHLGDFFPPFFLMVTSKSHSQGWRRYLPDLLDVPWSDGVRSLILQSKHNKCISPIHRLSFPHLLYL